MSQYIDGYAFPISKDRLEDYVQLAKAIAAIWKEHGAINYLEFVGDDLHLPGTRSFVDVLQVNDGETVVFGWVVFESREDRELANKKVAADPRMAELMSKFETGFDASRMAYGGFASLVAGK